jgi:hypothetical protein
MGEQNQIAMEADIVTFMANDEGPAGGGVGYC